MKKALIAGGALAIVLLLLVLAIGSRDRDPDYDPAEAAEATLPPSTAATTNPALAPSNAEAAAEAYQSFLYGRITTDEGATYEGRLRWGGDEEAFWGDYFNGRKDENPWAAQAPPEQLEERLPIQIFGLEVAERARQIELGRPFMARFGDIARIEAQGRVILVTLKSGTVFHLDQLSADDLADGLRVWDSERGVVDFDEPQISVVELLPTARIGALPERLQGTVRTRLGDFTGFVQWDWGKSLGTDALYGYSADDELELPFDSIRSIARSSPESSLVTLLDGGELELAGSRDVGRDNRGIYVDDERYGRVLIAWEAFERVDFSPADSGPAYGDFPTGRPLTGSVTTRAGQRLAGRLVYDLDESETTETLDAPSEGVNYSIPFGLVASILLPGPEASGDPHASVTLHSGDALQLERAGDLGETNAGMLVFVDGQERPESVLWADVERIDFDRPPAMYPSLGGR